MSLGSAIDFDPYDPPVDRNGTCPPDRTFTRLIDGTLTGEPLRALQTHCDACGRCARTMAELARTLSPNDEQWLGGRYRLLAPLGAGGMGVVYTALDTKLQRKVAIKRLRESGTDASIERRRERFLREAQLLASLSHPNVLTVHDVGGTEGRLYVVTELVDGWSMSQWVAQATDRPQWRRLVGMYLQAGRGLSAAHRLGVVHRDVKPENILVARSGRVLIGDFGLAGLTEGRPEDGDGAGDAGAGPLTQTGAVLGTPAYMAPEVHAGKTSDSASDQFAFCTSLYESLHGRRPFAGHDRDEIVAATRVGRLPLGSDGVPRALDRVLARGLAAERTKRFPSMDALLGELEQARDRPVLRPAVAAAAGAAVLLVLITGAMTTRDSGSTALTAVSASTTTAPPVMPPSPPLGRAPPPAAVVASGHSAVAATLPAKPGVRINLRRAHIRAAASHSTLSTLPALPARAGGDWQPGQPDIDVGPLTDPLLLLYLADAAHSDRDGIACLTALDRLTAEAWPPALADLALRRRAACEMLRGNCQKGQRLLEPLDGDYGAREAALVNCPAASFGIIEDRLSAIAAQADETRYAGNRPARREELERILARQTASPEVQACFRDRVSPRACGRRLAGLARGYQVLAEAFLAAGDCRTGALLDVMHSQIKSIDATGAEPALRCRSERTSEMYSACASAGQHAERRCLDRVQAATAAGAGVVVPELGR